QGNWVKENVYQERLSEWSFPQGNWIKENVDGLVRGSSIHGDIFRNATGSWLEDFPKHIELWGILIGLQMAWEKEYSQVWIESDSQVATDLIHFRASSLHPP
ncbi:putative ribonuclease H protein, partial [Mucuna pruriens]